MQPIGGDDEWKENRILREENERLKAKQDKSAQSMHRALRMINFGNAVALCFSGFWSLLTSAFRPIVFIFGFYIILFSCCIGCFEFRCPIDLCTKFFLKNMGFMFRWQGRLAFYLFVASLVIGQGIVGLIVGSATIANCVLNVYVMCKYPEYFKMLEKENVEMAGQALEKELQQRVMGTVANAAVGYAMKEVSNQAQQKSNSIHAMMGMDEVDDMMQDGMGDLSATDFDGPMYGTQDVENQNRSLLG
mmetsp:Transcript_25714/g.61926  ORF Transcript_25714/g.61926 Transcript_25714/m.61926 type:complete len:247 (-) Transcript_25714:225-965(-)